MAITRMPGHHALIHAKLLVCTLLLLVGFKPALGKVILRARHTPRAPAAEGLSESQQNDIRAASVYQAKQWAASDGLVLWTLANYGWRDFALNWVATVNHAGIEHWFIATLDEKLHAELSGAGVRCVALPSGLGSENIEWGSDAFKARGMEKIRFIREMLAAGLQPLFSDLDVVWLRNPLPFVRQLQDPNVLVSSDSWAAVANATLDNCQQEMGSEQTVEGHDSFVGKMNVGIHLLRPSALPFVEAWLHEMEVSGAMEQLCWNRAFLSTMMPASSLLSDPYCRAMDGRITAGLLPASLFQNGLTFFVQNLPHVLDVQPFAVHASYVPGNFDKVHHFRESLLWHADPAERYSQASKLLTLDIDIPSDLLAAAGPPAEAADPDGLTRAEAAGHLRLIQVQYLQIRAAAEIAKALGCSLILPQLWCGLENLWMPHPGRLPGGVPRPLPAPCPMSQLFHPHMWEKDTLGPQELPHLLESSFLRHPLTGLKHGDMLHVTACNPGHLNSDSCCASGVESCPQQHQLKLRQGLGKEEVLQVLDQHAAAPRVLKLSRVGEWWPAKESQNSAFSAAFDETRRGFCCFGNGSHVDISLDENIPLPAASLTAAAPGLEVLNLNSDAQHNS